MQSLSPKKREGLSLSDKTARESAGSKGSTNLDTASVFMGGKLRHFLGQSEMKRFSRSISTFLKAVLLTLFSYRN